MCKVLKVSRSGYYEWFNRTVSKRMQENELILKKITEIHKDSKQTYGSPRITEVLRNENIPVSRPRVARLMSIANIRCIPKRRFVHTTDSNHNYPIVGNILNRKFRVDKVGKVWVSDITYIPTNQGWLYLTVVIDLGDRKVIGWSLSPNMTAKETTIAAYKMAMSNRLIKGDLIFHSDRGVQYACTEFKTLLEGNRNVIRSMSRKGNCWDNAVAESFFKTLKSELIYRNQYRTRKEAALSIFEYIEAWYNRKRIHSTLGYKCPIQLETSIFKNRLVA